MPVPVPPVRPSSGLRRAAVRTGLAGAGLLVTAGGLTPVVVAGGAAAGGAGTSGDVTPDPADAPAGAPLLAAPTLRPASASSEVLSGLFGTGKQADDTDFGTVDGLGLFVAGSTGEAPVGASTDGSVLDFTNADGAVAGHCTSHHPGGLPDDLSLCLIAVTGSDAAQGTGPDGAAVDTIAPGTYTVTQSAAAPGFAVQPGVLGTVTFDPAGSDIPLPWFVLDPAVFGHSLTVGLTRAGTTTPVPGAAYTVTGPDWPAPASSDTDGADADGADADGPPPPSDSIGPSGTKTWGPVTSGPDGTLTFGGDADADWFAPGGSYALTPVTIPTGYQADSAGPLVVRPAVTAGGPVTASHALHLVPAVTPPTTAAAPAAATTTAPAQNPARTRHSSQQAADPAASTSDPSPAPAPQQPLATAPEPDSAPAASTEASPALATESSAVSYTSILTFGGPFVVALGAVILLIVRRRRARYQHRS